MSRGDIGEYSIHELVNGIVAAASQGQEELRKRADWTIRYAHATGKIAGATALRSAAETAIRREVPHA